MVALGGWTFNDNGTQYQPVYSNIVSSASNRASILLSFLRQNVFDGVDFDWVCVSNLSQIPFTHQRLIRNTPGDIVKK